MSTCTSGEDLLREGNVEFLDKNYKSAIKLYTESIELDDTLLDTYLKRALCYAKVKNYQAALGDANKAISLDPMSAKAYSIKGETSFILGDYQTAQESFEKCSNLDRKDSIYSVWVERCKTASKGPKPTPPKSTPTPTPSSTTSTAPKPTTTSNSSSNSTSSSQSSTASAPKPAQPKNDPQPPRPQAAKAQKAPRAQKAGSQPSTPKPEPTPEPEPAQPAQPTAPAPAPIPQRYTWYQTDNFVTVTVFVKAAKPSDVKIDFEEKGLSVNIDLSADNQFLLDLDLAHEINPSESKFEVMSTKIEIKMKKTTPVKWATIERKEEEVAPQAKKPKEKNWDKILANEEEDKDTSFNQLMRDMYSCASEDERRAMMKSFHESGGTVLSADWKDVGKGNVDPKPPVGVTKWEKDAV